MPPQLSSKVRSDHSSLETAQGSRLPDRKQVERPCSLPSRGRLLADYSAILGAPGNKPFYAIAGDLLGRYLMQRATIFMRMKQFDAAATDMTKAVEAGGTASVLRPQVYLRQHGFPDIAIDGRPSDALVDAIRACFRLNGCSQGLVRHS